MSEDSNTNGWNEWSKHVLKELQRLNVGQDNIKNEIHDIKSSLSEISILKNDVSTINAWKNHMTEIVSPTQLKDFLGKVDSLEKYKIKFIAVFGFIQVALAVAMAVASYLI